MPQIAAEFAINWTRSIAAQLSSSLDFANQVSDRSYTTRREYRATQSKEKFNESGTCPFFAQFGTITNLPAHSHKSVAVIKFENCDQTKVAHSFTVGCFR